MESAKLFGFKPLAQLEERFGQHEKGGGGVCFGIDIETRITFLSLGEFTRATASTSRTEVARNATVDMTATRLGEPETRRQP